MRQRTPFLPGISHHLCGRLKRSERDQLLERIERLRRDSLSRLCELFGSWLPRQLFTATPRGPNSRQRLYPVSLTFWAFLSQVLDPSSSCREAVRKVQGWYAQQGETMPESGNGAYCQARQRLPLKILRSAHSQLSGRLQASPAPTGMWKGRHLRVVDGTGVSMPDTGKNRQRYSQPAGQKPGCGFPVMKLVGIFCLRTGALLHWVQGRLEAHECRLFSRVIDFFNPGDLVVADRGFSGYGQLAALQQQRVDCLMRLHPARKVNWRKGRKLGTRDRLVCWPRPYRQTSVFEAADWAALATELKLRMVAIRVTVPGFRTQQLILITTLLDPVKYPAEELGRLYLRRWAVEVFYRDIKQSMAMDILRCKSPEMIDKELLMHGMAYNLIRALMKDIAASHQIEIERISFKGTLDALRQWRPLFEGGARGLRVSRKRIALFYQIVAKDPLIIRPERSEPRAVKRRPKNYRRLTKPRHEMVVERSGKRSQKPSMKALI